MSDSLDKFVYDVTGQSHLRVEQDLGDGFVRLRISEAERRQAIQDIRSSEDIVLELLRNSRDAHSRNIFLAVSRNEDERVLTIVDDGDGVPSSMHAKIFEPRVTSKLNTSHVDKWGYHGRGMALYSIAANSDFAGILLSEPGKGTVLQVRTHISELGERKDQSSFPTFIKQDDGSIAVRGPRNIIRIACEFAIEARNDCSIRVGSPTEIAAALYEFGKATVSPSTCASSIVSKSNQPCWMNQSLERNHLSHLENQRPSTRKFLYQMRTSPILNEASNKHLTTSHQSTTCYPASSQQSKSLMALS